jgi:ketosteroid isomerase-like protein
MKKVLLLLTVMLLISCSKQINKTKGIEEIKLALHKSAEDWSTGNIEVFMDVYWKSEKLQFIGKNGITYGWQQTLDNYKKRYPTKEHTGKLTFKVLSVDFLAKDLYSLIGEYHLDRNLGNADGIFTLIFKKIDDKWLIISDHSQ